MSGRNTEVLVSGGFAKFFSLCMSFVSHYIKMLALELVLPYIPDITLALLW